jgi:hypothetical protein
MKILGVEASSPLGNAVQPQRAFSRARLAFARLDIGGFCLLIGRAFACGGVVGEKGVVQAKNCSAVGEDRTPCLAWVSLGRDSHRSVCMW